MIGLNAFSFPDSKGAKAIGHLVFWFVPTPQSRQVQEQMDKSQEVGLGCVSLWAHNLGALKKATRQLAAMNGPALRRLRWE